MTGIGTLLDEAGQVRARRRRLILVILLIVVGLHVLAGIVAGIFVVARYIFPPPATFEVKRDLRLPAKQREHRMNMAAFDAMTPKPSFTDKMQSLRPAPFALPDLPKVPLDQMLPLDPAALVSDQVTALAGTAGFGSGGAGVSGLGGLGAGFSFLGVQSTGRRILLLFDVSTSVANKAASSGMPLGRIREETIEMISKLPATSRFGIIQFTQNYKPFRQELVPATDANREAVTGWLETEWVESGTMTASSKVATNPRGVVGVLEAAAPFEPDVVFLLSDGSFQWRADGKIANIPWKEFSKALKALSPTGRDVPVHFIAFQMKPADKRELLPIIRHTGGRLREIK